MAKRPNKRVRSRKGKSTRAAKRDRTGSQRSVRSKRKSRGSSNRRVDPNAPAPPAPPNPVERKARNRTLLLLVVLGLVNAYMFWWRPDGGLDLFQLESTAIGQGPEQKVSHGLASPREEACNGDPVRVFAGLEDQLFVESELSGERTFRLGMLELGVAGTSVDALEAEVGRVIHLGLLQGPLRAALDRDGGVSAFEVELAEGHLLQGCRTAGGMDVRQIRHPLRTDVAVIGLELARNAYLMDAVVEAEEDPALARLVAAALAGNVDLMSEGTPGDSIQVIVEKRYLGRHFHRYGRLLGIRFMGEATKTASFHYKVPGRDPSFYDREGQPTRREFLRSPVAWHPYDAEGRGRLPARLEYLEGRVGAIYDRGEGAPLVAVADAQVRDAGMRGDLGFVIELELDDGRVLRYAHLRRALGDLQPGDRVSQGQLIALVGHSGKTRRARLRFEILAEDGSALDPGLLLDRRSDVVPRVGEPIAKDELEQFEQDVRPWHRALRQAG